MQYNVSIALANVAGKMSDITVGQIPAYLTICVEEIGSDVIVIDLREAAGQPDVMTIMASRLNFPDYFGGNLDALYDVVGERVSGQVSDGAVPQTWLFKSTTAQQKMLFPIADTIRDAMSGAVGNGVTVLWLLASTS